MTAAEKSGLSKSGLYWSELNYNGVTLLTALREVDMLLQTPELFRQWQN